MSEALDEAVKRMRELMAEFPPAPRDEWRGLVHPLSLPAMREAYLSPETEHLSCRRPTEMMGIPIIESDLVPSHDIQETWISPPSGQYTGLTAADELWARPLGLGSVVHIDQGPVWYLVNVAALAPKFEFVRSERHPAEDVSMHFLNFFRSKFATGW